MISVSLLVNVVLILLIGGVIFLLLDWLIRYVGLPAPFDRVAKIVLAIGAVFVCIGALLTLVGYPVFRP